MDQANPSIQKPSLYIHVPFCYKKCDYCAFFSLSLNDLRLHGEVEAYLEGLESEMQRRQQDALQGVSSLFIGGGTPTALTESELKRLLIGINKNFRMNESTEKTIEGNPGTLTLGKLSVLRAFGINRFSLGVQSFDDIILRRIGRIHRADDARRSIKEIREAGFDNLNLDLMFGLPGQDLAAWKESVEEALVWSPEHLSLYGLMLEEGTELYRKLQPLNQGLSQEISLPDDDHQADMYDWAVERLEKAGYLRYETSNFAKSGYECQHNLAYWHGYEYLGLGPGAVSYQEGARFKNIEDIQKYREFVYSGKGTTIEREELSDRERMAERIILGLRLTRGMELEVFARDFGVRFEDIYQKELEKYEKQGILFREEGYLKLNPQYCFIANAILQKFI